MSSLEVGRGLRPRRDCAATYAAGSEIPPYLCSPISLAPALLAAFWPVWRWYVARMSDGSDEPLGLVALVTAVAFFPRQGWREQIGRARLLGAAAALGLYVVAFDFVPLLVRGMLAMVAIACVLPRDRSRPALPLIALLLLSLPLIATLQFYLGYPVRAVTAWCAAHLLDLGGHAVVARGTVLHWAGEEILVDAPCSGIRMLWTAAFLSAALAAAHRLSAWRYVRLAQLTAAIVFAANLGRTLLLFFLETGLWPNPPWAHEAAGLTMFLLATGACVAAARWLRPKEILTRGDSKPIHACHSSAQPGGSPALQGDPSAAPMEDPAPAGARLP